MIFAKTDDEKMELLKTELNSAKDAKWYIRLKIIQLSAQGLAVPNLAKQFDVSKATVRDYIKRYNSDGLNTLKRTNGKGRKPKIALSKEQWEELLHQSPCQFDKLNTNARNWTQELLVLYCYEYLKVDINQPSICMLLKRMKIKWNRGKLKVTSPDPLYIVKRERVDTLKKSSDGNVK